MHDPLGWTLVFHIIGIVMWIGGLLAVTQIMAQSAAATEPAAREAYASMARRALNALAHAGLVLTVGSGVILLFLIPPAMRMAAWLHIKLTLVVLLIGLDIWLARMVNRMPAKMPARGRAGMMHGLFASLFFVILILVLLQP